MTPMISGSSDGSVIIAGLGLRLGPVPAEPRTTHIPEGIAGENRVFVTELVSGGAAERSNLLRLNDEILHVDHCQTSPSRTVHDVKNSILGTPGTSVRIGIRRNNEQFELSFVRGHTQNSSSNSAAQNQSSHQPPSSMTKGTPTNNHTSSAGIGTSRPTPKALFKSPGHAGNMLHIDTDVGVSNMSLQEAAKRGDLETVAMLAAELAKSAKLGDSKAVRNMLRGVKGDLSISPNTVSVAHTPRGVLSSESPTLLFDGQPSPSNKLSSDEDNARRLLGMIEPLMDFSSSTLATPPPPIDKGLLRDLIISLAGAAAAIQQNEPRMLELPSPCYVLGDIHGNLTDLQFFRKTLWPAGVQTRAGDVLFLGDFVDRGLDSVPVVAYIIAQKVLNPYKWWMIRGNHETREVNGNVKTYREGSFLHQCTSIFGEDDGRNIWEASNDFFDTLPVAARVGGQIFCVHGGLPREMCEEGSSLMEINKIPCPLRNVRRGDMVHAMLWSDPVPPEREGGDNMLDKLGFGLSSRGCACFGEKALDIFLDKHDLSYVFRGHEAQQHGIGLSKSARLCTIFSTSKDHFQSDAKTTCGCVLVDHGSIVPIVRGDAPKTIGRTPSPSPVPRPPMQEITNKVVA